MIFMLRQQGEIGELHQANMAWVQTISRCHQSNEIEALYQSALFALQTPEIPIAENVKSAASES